MDAFDRIAREFGVAIVEDAAQAIGAEWSGRGAGSLGVTAAFSFYPTKNLSAYGDAGIVTTSRPEMAEHMRQLRNHGSPRRYYHNEFGWNGRMDAIQAAVLRVKLPHIADWNQSRRQHAATYDQLFASTGLTNAQTSNQPSNESCAPVRLLARSPQAKHVFHQYVIRAQRRDELRQFLGRTKNWIGNLLSAAAALAAGLFLSRIEGGRPAGLRTSRPGSTGLAHVPGVDRGRDRVVVESIAEFYS